MIKTIFSITILTLMARLLSLVSLQIYMAYFGPQNVQLNIYSYALNVPNIIFNVLGTAVIAVVVPIYSGLLAKGEGEKAKNFLKDIITIISLVVFVIIGLGFLAAPLLAGLTEYRHVREDFEFLVFALRAMLPVMFFYGLSYVFQGYLHSNGKFRLPAFITVPSSLIVIGYTVFFSEIYGVTGLLFATVIGLSMQAIILLPAVIKSGFRYSFSLNLNSPEVRQAMMLFVPVLISGLSFQINSIFNSTLATRFNMVTIMSYVQNLMLVIVLSVVYSMTAVYLPKLSELWAKEDIKGFKNALENAIGVVIFLMVPATAGFFLLRFEIINLLARWGDFDEGSAVIAANMLGLYGLGILSIGMKEILDRGFYAQKDSRTPAVFGFLIMAINIGFSLVFVSYLGMFTMAVSFAVSTTVGVVGLLVMTSFRVKFISGKLVSTFVKAVISTGFMVLSIYYLLPIVRGIDAGNEILSRVIQLGMPALVGVVVYFFVAIVIGMEQMAVVKGKMNL